MEASYKILTPQDLQAADNPNLSFSMEVLNGLSEYPKRLSSKYFYDDEGSRLFQKIMHLDEYYLTQGEFEIFRTQKSSLLSLLVDEAFNIVELGAGDGAKTSVLIDYFLNQGLEFKYIPVDISEGAMRTLTQTMKDSYPGLKITGLVAEYFDGLKWLSGNNRRRNLVLLLGSNLGNFPKPQAKVFLRSLWNTLKDGDYVLIGFDLKKDIDLMLDAYNDPNGVTAAFNLNLLTRINRELGGTFNLGDFRFFATYNVFSGAIESYLVSLKKQTVLIKEIGQNFLFRAWEPIHTEYSYKYLSSDIVDLAESTGFTIVKQLFDSKKYFVDSVWQVSKKNT